MSKRQPAAQWCMLWIFAALVPLASCADDSEAATEAGLTLRLVIPDANIREPDVPCSGARAFRFAHPEAPFTIEDASGEQVASGALPEGTAEKAFNIDLGDDRQPTVCVMNIVVEGVESLDGHALVISDRAPVPIEPNRNLDNIPEVVLR